MSKLTSIGRENRPFHGLFYHPAHPAHRSPDAEDLDESDRNFYLIGTSANMNYEEYLKVDNAQYSYPTPMLIVEAENSEDK